MDQQPLLPESSEQMTDAEVRALVERFGERQAMAYDQPTVLDVAEALQVEPMTVASMLVELRRSSGQHEIREKVDRLEVENADLCQGAEAKSARVGLVARPDGDRTLKTALFAALCFVTVLTVAGALAGEPNWWLGVVPLTFALIALTRFRRT